MTKTKTKTKMRLGSFWVCPNCEGSPEFKHEEMMKHISEVHQIDVFHTKGKRITLMHLDGADFYIWKYEWEIAGKKFLQTSTSKRSANASDRE